MKSLELDERALPIISERASEQPPRREGVELWRPARSTCVDAHSSITWRMRTVRLAHKIQQTEYEEGVEYPHVFEYANTITCRAFAPADAPINFCLGMNLQTGRFCMMMWRVDGEALTKHLVADDDFGEDMSRAAVLAYLERCIPWGG